MNQQYLCGLSDDSYLDVTDMNILLKHLMHQVLVQKPENPVEFSRYYFERVQSCHHVIGADFSFVSACQHNRRAFVFCCMESFQNFNPREEISLNDYHQLLQMICSDIPMAIVEQAAEIIDPVVSSDPLKYTYNDFMLSLYFHLIYHDWLKELQKLFSGFDSGSNSEAINANRLQSKMLSWQTDLSETLKAHTPSQDAIDAVVTNLAVTSTKGSDINLKQFKKAILQIQVVQDDICSRPRKADPLLLASFV